MSEAPQWLEVMRAITGLTEYENGSNPKIVGMARYIGHKFPEQKEYSDLYRSDDTAWCGVTAAFCMAVCNIRGPFGKTDTDKWMWALSWADGHGYVQLDAPRLGCVVVMEREGGGHVTLYEGSDNGMIRCRGGNQSNAVNVQSYDPDTVVAYVWPRGVPIPPAEREEIAEGDEGSDVVEVQRILGLPADGDFGPITDSGVRQFQGAADLVKDGCVGPMTWGALDDLDRKMKAGSEGLGEELEVEIEDLCARSPVNGYNWDDRGDAPKGYYLGMAKCFAWALENIQSDAVKIMASKATTNDDIDALAWYADELDDADLDTSKNGSDTLRALFVLMIGLGMRESSGNHWEGRDMSADNVQSDTCEAGLFQTSWDISPCSSAIPPLLEQFWDDPNGFRLDFDVGVSPTASNLDAYGSGDGARYQFLAKYSPLFHVLVTGVGMRKRRQHWGPINRKEVELVGMVDDLLIEVERLVDNA